MRAEVLYRHTVGPEPRTPEEVAEDYDLPVEVVREAVEYSIRNKPLLDAERQRADERLREAGFLDPVLSAWDAVGSPDDAIGYLK